MNTRINKFIRLFWMLSMIFLVSTLPKGLAQDAVSISLFKLHGDEVEWCWANNKIAYASRGKDNLYGIHTCSPDGGNDIFLTQNNPLLPPGHKGSPCWHPSGRLILFVAEKRHHPGTSFPATPGLGSYTDLWVMTADGKSAWQLTNLPVSGHHGIIIPKFSHDGHKIVWAERYSRLKLINQRQICGFWDLKVADFVVRDGVPSLANIRTIRPAGVEAFNESYGFSPDDKSIIFCSDYNQRTFWTSQIFTCDVTGSNIKQLTSKGYNEHACYSPNGKYIVWMTNVGEAGGTDWWIMKSDGSDKRQLTFFNKPGHKEHSKHKLICCLGTFSKDGSYFLGGVQNSLIFQTGDSYMVKMPAWVCK